METTGKRELVSDAIGLVMDDGMMCWEGNESRDRRRDAVRNDEGGRSDPHEVLERA